MTNPPFLETPKKRILVVDDAPDNLFLVQSILEEEGYESILAENGQEAIAIVETSPPHLVLLDVMMPGMDGFAVTRHIRANSYLPYIPILLITAHDRASVVQGLDSGADDFIRKPVEVEELLARVRSLLRLKQSTDEREDFVSRLAHDLRTPLVAADRMLQLLQQGALGELSPNIAEAIAVMSRSNLNLLEMVNTLLEVYRYEAGQKTLHFCTLTLPPLITEVIEELTPLAQAKGLKLTTTLGDLKQPFSVEGDRLELRRVFTNLLGNAIKFTEKGEINLSLQNTSEGIILEVKDTGIGIAPEEQKYLFQRFRQGSHRLSGSGLGLYLSGRIIETHKGHITLESELGKGSLFRVIFPPSPNY